MIESIVTLHYLLTSFQPSPLIKLLSFHSLCNSITYLFSYVLTPWSRVLLEKLTSCQLVKNFLRFYGTERFITAFPSARHLSLSWASSIQSINPYPTTSRSILILSSPLCLGLPSDSFSHISPPIPYIRLSSPPYTSYTPRPSLLPHST